MTYFGFLLRFIGVPLFILAALVLYKSRRGRLLPLRLTAVSPWFAILLHVVIAVVYTTPWDNYLVATRVWWYDPALVTGLTLGWVPIEEYTFFVVQSLLLGLWLVLIANALAPQEHPSPLRPRLRLYTLILPALLWIAAVAILLAGWQPGTYLALELGWAIPPIMLQLAFGADILWRYRGLVITGIGVPTLYLSITDALAIESGTWTIDPAQSLNILLGGVLPIEEFLFFLLTCTMLIFGMTLFLARESQERIPPPLRQRLQRFIRSAAKITIDSQPTASQP